MALGLALRLIGANWGFPVRLHPDEHAIALVPAQMAERVSLDPIRYEHPDHVLSQLL